MYGVFVSINVSLLFIRVISDFELKSKVDNYLMMVYFLKEVSFLCVYEVKKYKNLLFLVRSGVSHTRRRVLWDRTGAFRF